MTTTLASWPAIKALSSLSTVVSPITFHVRTLKACSLIPSAIVICAACLSCLVLMLLALSLFSPVLSLKIGKSPGAFTLQADWAFNWLCGASRSGKSVSLSSISLRLGTWQSEIWVKGFDWSSPQPGVCTSVCSLQPLVSLIGAVDTTVLVLSLIRKKSFSFLLLTGFFLTLHTVICCPSCISCIWTSCLSSGLCWTFLNF